MHLEDLIPVLEASIRKNGDKSLTISHLLNILRKMQRDTEREDRQCGASECDIY